MHHKGSAAKNKEVPFLSVDIIRTVYWIVSAESRERRKVCMGVQEAIYCSARRCFKLNLTCYVHGKYWDLSIYI